MPYNSKQKQSDYHKQWYADNKADYVKKVQERNIMYKNRNRKFVQRYKQMFACTDCGVKYHFSQMDFDHIAYDKVDAVARLVNAPSSLTKIKAEIRKCELVCSNCHRFRTWTRMQEKHCN